MKKKMRHSKEFCPLCKVGLKKGNEILISKMSKNQISDVFEAEEQRKTRNWVHNKCIITISRVLLCTQFLVCYK